MTLPVIDAAGYTRSDPAGRVLIALHGHDGAVGVAADRLSSVVTFEIDQVERVPRGYRSPLGVVAARVVDRAGHSIDCLDPASLSPDASHSSR